MSDLAKIRADFDRIALLPPGGGVDHNAAYHQYLMRHVPTDGSDALDIGCGTGEFARQLARRCRHVVAIDLSPNMIRVARERSADFSNIDYRVAEVTTLDLGDSRYDCIASIAALHHVSAPALLPRLAAAVRPGGVLLILDLRQSRGLVDRILDCAGMAVHALERLIHGPLGPHAAEVRHAWHEHGKTDRYLTMPQVRSLCDASLPGAVVRRQVRWRYSLVWTKPPGARGGGSAATIAPA
jgi:ubiquinone/menaquinone biosynthesis C-methylase UbiE